MVILGGSGSVSGAIIGGVFVTVTVKLIEQFQPFFREQLGALADVVQPRTDTTAGLPQTIAEALRNLDLNALRMVVYAAVLIGLMILRPEGLFGERELFQRKRPPSKGGGSPRKQTISDVKPPEERAKEAADEGRAPEVAS
jgi:branched-chain amino acid transport system permease protein